MKKNLSNLSDEDLLKLLDNLDDNDYDPDSNPEFDSSVMAFVANFNLKPGKDRVVKKHLYKLYQLWNKGIHKLAQPTFTREVTNYFEDDVHFYLIDKSAFDITKFIREEKAKRKIDKTKSKHWHSHFKSFLEDSKLEEGKIFIELEILYYLYLQWRNHARKTAILSRQQFLKICQIHFDVKVIDVGNHFWVGLNEQIKNLITKKEVVRWRKNRDKKKKRFYNPSEEWRQYALYWEEKTEPKTKS